MSNDRIYLSSPDVTQREEDALVRAIRSGWIAPLGPDVDAFELELADYCGREYAVVLSSGTAALHLALLTAGIGEGDIVLTSSMTFAATANAIVYTGAEPVFVDCDESGNIDPTLLEEAFQILDAEGKTVKAVVPVDLLGKAVEHDRVAEIAQKYEATVISDAAESLGAVFKGKPAPSFGLAAAVSFNGNKIMTTSGGGALLTDNKEFADHVRYLATQARQPVVHYEHVDIGYNYRMSNILAAMGRAQLSRLDSMIQRRCEHRLRYLEFFAKINGVEMFGDPSIRHDAETKDNFWLTSILIDPRISGFTSDQLRAALTAANIEARPLWKPMHLQPIYKDNRAFVNGISEKLFSHGLSLPSGSVLTDHEMDRVLSVIEDFCDEQL